MTNGIRAAKANARATSRLSASMEMRLKSYAIAAAAAGAGLFSAAQPASAQVIFTAANLQLTDGNLFLDLTCGPHVNFWIANNIEGTIFGGNERELALNGSINGSVIEDSRGPAALPAGSVVGSSRVFTNVHKNEQIMADAYRFIYYGTYTGAYGNFANKKQVFLGLKFNLQGQPHYGWAEFSVDASVQKHRQLIVNATLLGYAYESTPGKAIQTGEGSAAPGSLQALAQGVKKIGSCPDYEPHALPSGRLGRNP